MFQLQTVCLQNLPNDFFQVRPQTEPHLFYLYNPATDFDSSAIFFTR
ncbi:hypothetical protein UNH65_27645 [Chitinophaga sp. 180180018-2]|nr:hypothetical protein [Chitinophaga sp. 212800010-3]